MEDRFHILPTNFRFDFIADAYYASGKIVKKLLKNGNHLITRVKNNAVAYYPATEKKNGRGRKKVYGESNRQIRYLSVDLIWRAAGTTVRFVVILHSNRGKCILMPTDLTLQPLEIIRLYRLRFKIEVSFKQAVRTIGAYAYHFWMKPMKPIKRYSGNQYIHTLRNSSWKE